MSELSQYKKDFLRTCLEAGALNFGTFTLKSGRQSPYFFNAGLFHSGKLVRALSTAFASSVAASPGLRAFDVLFGPAYKGIPLAATTVDKLYGLDPAAFADVHYCFDRKTAKTYGDGGILVGSELKGKRVVIIDDVITAGTAIRESIKLINQQGGTLVGIIVALDRQEKAPIPGAADDSAPAPSAIGQLRKEYGIPVEAIICLDDLIQYLESEGKEVGTEDDRQRMLEYRQKYAPTE